jgi:GNAT superfamily N-acetyltransferase
MQTPFTIAHADTESSIARCFPVMSQLRPDISEPEFVPRVQRQQQAGYRLAYLEADSRIRAVAGYRILESLAWGRFCYVDDLVTDEHDRSQGYGHALFDWLLDRAREAGCRQFHLDSGVQRFAAHRFYLTNRMDITCHHFAMSLEDDGRA